MSSYHDRMMNIPASEHPKTAYKIGHRDTRHAAAEIASEADAEIEQLRREQDDVIRDSFNRGYECAALGGKTPEQGLADFMAEIGPLQTKDCGTQHQWDYSGREAICSECGLTATQNLCKHESVSPPNAGAYRCNDCNMTFSERPLLEKGSQCPGCGYTEDDATLNGDHRLCGRYPYFESEQPASKSQQKRLNVQQGRPMMGGGEPEKENG